MSDDRPLMTRMVCPVAESCYDLAASVAAASFHAVLIVNSQDPIGTTLLDTNDRASAMWGYSRSEFLSMRLVELLDPDFARDLGPIGGPGEYLGVWPMRRKDGSKFFADVRTRAGRFAGIEARIITLRDITVEREAMLQLAASEDRYRSLVESSPDAIGVHSDGKWVYMNPAGLEIFGYKTHARMLGADVLDLVAPEDRRFVAQLLQATYRGTVTQPVMVKMGRPGGSLLAVELSSVPIEFEGRPCVRTVLRDVTRLREAEALRTEVEVLREAEAIKDEFLRIVSHELRTPLNVISGFSYLLRAGGCADREKAVAFLDEIDKGTRKRSGGGAGLRGPRPVVNRRDSVAA